MKNQMISKYLMAMLVGTSAIYFVMSCQKSEPELPAKSPVSELQSASLFSMVSKTVNLSFNDIKLPDGMDVVKVSNSTVRFVFPKGMVFLGIGQDGVPATYTSMGYQCDCSKKGGGCDVYTATEKGKTITGCASGTCDGSCTGTKTKEAKAMTPEDYELGGVIDLSKGVKLIVDDDDLKSDFSAPKAKLLMSYKPVADALEAFIENAYGKSMLQLSKEDISQNPQVAVDVFGVKMALHLPLKYVQSKNGRYSSGDKPTCNCTEGSGCTLEEVTGPLGVNVGWKCVGGGCSKCAMKKIPQK